MRALGIDPGTATGWCVLEAPLRMVACGLIRGGRRAKESEGSAYARTRTAIREVIETYLPSIIFHETWIMHKGVYAAHKLGAYQAMIQEEVYNAGGLPCIALSVTAIKAFATGHPHADKAKMAASARLLWPSADFQSYDVVDAAHIARLGLAKHIPI